MRKILGLVLVLGAGATIGAISRPEFLAHAIDHPVSASPCGSVQTVQAAPFVFDGAPWLSYLCADNRVILRQFNVWTSNTQNLPPVVCPSGFVHTGNKQGCVTPDHPLAGR
jgi:hypothetical protein